jgi:NAD(P) transhydrogenase
MHYDLIVIGSGPAGEKGAAQAAYFGKKVALIEREPFPGGAAANTGTLPSKTLRETALYLSGFRKRELYGLGFDPNQRINAAGFLAHFHNVRAEERARIDSNMERHGVITYKGVGSFLNANTVLVQSSDGLSNTLTATTVLIATGTQPHRPADYPWHDARLFDSDTILDIGELPDSLLVIGGGVIGSEYACIFAALGVRVTLVDARNRLLGFLDPEVSEALQSAMAGMGIQLVLGDSVEAICSAEKLDVAFKIKAAESYDAILSASGRQGNTAALGLGNIGLAPDKRGLLKVNEHYQTGVSNIYAAGDVIGFPALASTSMEQARLAMCHAFDLKYKTGLARILPLGIYTIPECSCAGETEESLREKGTAFVVGKANYARNTRGFIIGDHEGFLKLLFHAKDMSLVGVHCIGEQATDLIHTGLAALLLGQGADFFINTCFNYPTLSEMYKYAAYDALGRLQRGEIFQFSSDQ